MLNLIRVATAVPKLRVADCEYNAEAMLKLAYEAAEENVHILVFPELCISGYSCEDLFFQKPLLNGARAALGFFLKETAHMNMIILTALPVAAHNQLFNCAALCHKGRVMGIIPKMHLPNSGEFSENRWFTGAYDLDWDEIDFLGHTVPMGNDILFTAMDGLAVIGVEICRDVWEPVPPSSLQALAGANIILNPTASSEIAAKHHLRKLAVTGQSARTGTAYVYTAAGVYESTSALVFSGHSMIVEGGTVLAESKRFDKDAELLIRDIDLELLMNRRLKNNNYMSCYDKGARRKYRRIDIPLTAPDPDVIKRTLPANPFLPEGKAAKEAAFEDIFNIQSSALFRRLEHIGLKKSVLGVSGGLDSALVLLVAAKAMDIMGLSRENIIGLVMPGFGTTKRAYGNGVALINALGVTMREISIKEACLQHFKDIGHDPQVHDIVFENAQARERTQIAMDVANKENALQLGTGNMSEMALGFSTYGGDQISMYNVNCGVTKTVIRELVAYIAETALFGSDVSKILKDILDAPVSPELLPTDDTGNTKQITEDILGPYEVNDFFLYHMAANGFSPPKIAELGYHAFSGKYSREKLQAMLKNYYKLFFTSQFKRTAAPDGPKVLAVSLSNKGDVRMPSDAAYSTWSKF